MALDRHLTCWYFDLLGGYAGLHDEGPTFLEAPWQSQGSDGMEHAGNRMPQSRNGRVHLILA